MGLSIFLGVNTIQPDVQALLSCLSARGSGDYLDSNRDSGSQLGQLIRESSQINYSISRILDAETLAEGKILDLLNRRIGDATEVSDSTSSGSDTTTTIKPALFGKKKQALKFRK